ncbi:MAG: hypothetical protein FWC58_09765, partial [Desulfobulbus sp.]|nr:hypothetical protein [Desulfobulbus sp.]
SEKAGIFTFRVGSKRSKSPAWVSVLEVVFVQGFLKLLPHRTSPKNCFHPASRHDRGMTPPECAEHVKSKSMAM